MQNRKKFIVTEDKETASKLISQGFRLIAEVNGKFTFETNPNNIHFSQIDEKKVAYTNILSL